MAGQHGDEPSGSDALLRLLGELAEGSHPEWRGRLRLLVVPMVNAWGLERGVRGNGEGIDLNRDHLRLKAPETRALHRLFDEWAPHVTIDLHEKPEPCRHVEVARATHPAEDPRRRALGRLVAEEGGRLLAGRGIPSHLFFTRSFAVEPGSSPPRLEVFYHPALPDPSDSLNGFAVLGALAYFIETAAGPSDTPYAETVDAQYEAVTALVEAALDRAGAIRDAVDGFRAAPPRPRVALQMRQAERPLEPVAEFNPCGGIADRRSGVRPWMPRVEVTRTRTRPAAYLLPARFTEVAGVLAGHGVTLYTALHDVEVEGEPGWVVAETTPPPEDRGRPLAGAAFARRPVRVRAGDWVVPVASPHWDLVPILLEPESQFGLGRYVDLGIVPKVGVDYPVVRLSEWPPPGTIQRWLWGPAPGEPAGRHG
jgi:hypothetical protein